MKRRISTDVGLGLPSTEPVDHILDPRIFGRTRSGERDLAVEIGDITRLHQHEPHLCILTRPHRKLENPTVVLAQSVAHANGLLLFRS